MRVIAWESFVVQHIAQYLSDIRFAHCQRRLPELSLSIAGGRSTQPLSQGTRSCRSGSRSLPSPRRVGGYTRRDDAEHYSQRNKPRDGKRRLADEHRDVVVGGEVQACEAGEHGGHAEDNDRAADQRADRRQADVLDRPDQAEPDALRPKPSGGPNSLGPRVPDTG